MFRRVSNRTFIFWSTGISLLLLLLFLYPNQTAKAGVGQYTNCDFQPMAYNRTPVLDNIIQIPIGVGNPQRHNLSWDNTYLGLHRWTTDQWPGVDYLVETTIPFKNGGIVSYAGKDGAGGGNAVEINGTGPCKGWMVYWGHLTAAYVATFKVGQVIGPNDIVGKPSCTGFTDSCTLTSKGKVPPHNHVILGYDQNIFDFADGTMVVNQHGYWYIHPARVEGSGSGITPANQDQTSISYDASTEFSIDTATSVAPSGSDFFGSLASNLTPYKTPIVIGLALFLTLWLAGTIYSAEFRKNTWLISVIAIAAVAVYIGVNRAKANQPVALPRTADVSSATGWEIDSSAPIQVDTSTCTLPAQYPQSIRKWCSLIEKWAAVRNIDPRLIAADMMIEDPRGDPAILSVDGAVGLMQVMPNDGLSATKYGSMFAKRPSIAELSDPDTNIGYGTKMLIDLGVQTDPREALMKYGPSRYDFERKGLSIYTYADAVLAIYNSYK